MLVLVAQITICTLSLLHTSLKLSRVIIPSAICSPLSSRLSRFHSETVSHSLWSTFAPGNCFICVSHLAELLNIIADTDYSTLKFEKPGINECFLIFKTTRVIPFRVASCVTINPKEIRNHATVLWKLLSDCRATSPVSKLLSCLRVAIGSSEKSLSFYKEITLDA